MFQKTIHYDQQNRVRGQTFEGSRTISDHWCPLGSHAHICSKFSPIIPNQLNMPKTKVMGALLVANGLLIASGAKTAPTVISSLIRSHPNLDLAKPN